MAKQREVIKALRTKSGRIVPFRTSDPKKKRFYVVEDDKGFISISNVQRRTVDCLLNLGRIERIHEGNSVYYKLVNKKKGRPCKKSLSQQAKSN